MTTTLDETIWISGPPPTLELNFIDWEKVGLYSRRILCFEQTLASTSEQAIDCLKRAIEALVQGNPEIAGRVEAVPPTGAGKHGHLTTRAIKSYRGVELRIKDLTSSFESFEALKAAGFPIATFKDELLMPVPPEIKSDPLPVTVLQLTLIPGGMLFSFCMHHAYCDGNGMNTALRALAEQCILAARTEEALPPAPRLNVSRGPTWSIDGTKKDISEHPAYQHVPGGLGPGKSETIKAPPIEAPKMHILKYRISNANAEKLKAAIGTEGSMHDMISALLWRTLVLARYKSGLITDLNAISTYSCPRNARQYCGLAPDFVGNCIHMSCASLPVSTLLSSSLPSIARTIRHSITSITPDDVRSIIALKREAPYNYPLTLVTDIKNPANVNITSMYHGGMEGMDFGEVFGKVKCFTPSDVGAGGASLRGFAAVLGKFEGGRGCDVQIGVGEGERVVIEEDELWGMWMDKV